MTLIPDYVTNTYVNDLLMRALPEDVGSGDVSTLASVPAERRARAHIESRSAGIIAGVWMAERVFETVDSTLGQEWEVQDGEAVEPGALLGTVEGRAQSMLTAERLALNLMQRMSGIATMTRRMVDLAAPHGATILDTRKTAPGLRLLDKWAVRLGGGENHRIGLFDMILIKDNHIAAAGGIANAVGLAREYQEQVGRSLDLEVEVRTREEVEEALGLDGIDMLLLDNMVHRDENGRLDTSRLEEAVRLVDGRIRTEASGNVSLETVEAIARTGVDYISCGALTHSVHALDIGMTIELLD